VAIVLYSRMATVRAMLVAVSAGMLLVRLRHRLVLSQCGASQYVRAGQAALFSRIRFRFRRRDSLTSARQNERRPALCESPPPWKLLTSIRE
jgi:hypothetical protein